MNYGYGSKVLQELEKGPRRTMGLNFEMFFKDDTELDFFLNQTNLALDIEFKGGTLIDASGAFFYGAKLIIPSFKVNDHTRTASPSDYMVEAMECTILDDGTNPEVLLFVYNAQAAYLA